MGAPPTPLMERGLHHWQAGPTGRVMDPMGARPLSAVKASPHTMSSGSHMSRDGARREPEPGCLWGQTTWGLIWFI